MADSPMFCASEDSFFADFIAEIKLHKSYKDTV
jgi:hypothetical protein